MTAHELPSSHITIGCTVPKILGRDRTSLLGAPLTANDARYLLVTNPKPLPQLSLGVTTLTVR